MELNIIKKSNLNIKKDKVNIIIESNKNDNINDLINYINNYNNSNSVIVKKDYESMLINYKDIMLFYSDKKNNYCKTTSNETYKIKSKLYELEKIDNFIRISKCYIVNINHIKCFDLGQTGKIIIKMYDGTELKVSRRRISHVLNFLEDNSI